MQQAAIREDDECQATDIEHNLTPAASNHRPTEVKKVYEKKTTFKHKKTKQKSTINPINLVNTVVTTNVVISAVVTVQNAQRHAHI